MSDSPETTGARQATCRNCRHWSKPLWAEDLGLCVLRVRKGPPPIGPRHGPPPRGLLQHTWKQVKWPDMDHDEGCAEHEVKGSPPLTREAALRGAAAYCWSTGCSDCDSAEECYRRGFVAKKFEDEKVAAMRAAWTAMHAAMSTGGADARS